MHIEGDLLVDPGIMQLAGTAATTLVQSLTSDGWQQAKQGFSALWRRAQPERAEAIAAELELTRDDLIAARGSHDLDTATELSGEWQGRFRRLLAAYPEVADELKALLAELAPDQPAPISVQHATASGQARVFQAGRDQNFGQR